MNAISKNSSSRDPQGDERALVDRVRRGDSGAFTEIFDRHAWELVSFAEAQLHSQEHAEEIVQDVFLGIWTNRARWTLTVTLRTYLFQCVRHRILNARRDEVARLRIFPTSASGECIESVTAAPERTDEAAQEADLARALRHAIDGLPPRCREVFLMNREHGLSYSEIGAILGLSPKTVERHMGRALAALRAALRDWMA